MKRLSMFVILLFPLLFGGSAFSAVPQSKGGDDDVLIIRRGHGPGGYLGVSTEDADRDSTADRTSQGARVTDVREKSPADKAGIKEGDIILQVNGQTIGDRWDLLKIVREAKPGSQASIVVSRDGSRQTLTATLGEEPSPPRHAMIPQVPHPPQAPKIPREATRALRALRFPGDSYGLSLMELNEQLASYFGAPDKRGVLVEEVEEKSPAAGAGFKAGDVIVGLGKESVEDEHDVWSALEHYKDGEKADVHIIRKGARQTLKLQVADARGWKEFDDGAPMKFRHDFHWDSEKFDTQMKHLGERLGKMGKELEQRLQGLGDRIRLQLRTLKDV